EFVRVVAAEVVDEEREFDAALRPRWLSEFVGQARIKEQLQLLVEGAKARGEPLDHVLLSGPPGLGKTTLAGIVANELGVGFRPTSGPAPPPLRERFGFSPRLDYYSHGELSQVVARSAGILAMLVEAGGAEEIARRSRGTPRIANRLLRRVRDYAQVRGDGRVTDRVA